MSESAIALDWETASNITRATLIDYRRMLQEHTMHALQGGWIHPDDARDNQQILDAIEVVLSHFTP